MTLQGILQRGYFGPRPLSWGGAGGHAAAEAGSPDTPTAPPLRLCRREALVGSRQARLLPTRKERRLRVTRVWQAPPGDYTRPEGPEAASSDRWLAGTCSPVLSQGRVRRSPPHPRGM